MRHVSIRTLKDGRIIKLSGRLPGTIPHRLVDDVARVRVIGNIVDVIDSIPALVYLVPY